MSEISKQALKVDNNQSFPNNNAGAITPAILRAFNENMIDSMVDEISYNADSASWNSKISALDASGSAASVAALNQFTSSALITASFDNGTRNLTFTKGNLSTFSVNIPDVSGSDSNLTALNAFTASVAGTNTFTQSAQLEINSLEAFTASVAGTNAFTASVAGTNTFTQSAGVSINALNAATSSYAKTNINNQFTTDQTITGSLVVTGTITANELHVIIESSSIIYSSGSNQLGDELSDTQILSGSTKLVGSATLNGSPLITSAQTASYIQDLTALNNFTASVAGTNAFTASTQQSINAINAISGTWITEAESGSFIKSAGSSGTNVIQFTYGDGTITNVTVATGSATDISALNAFTASVAGTNAFTTSADLRLDSLEAATSSYANSASVASVDLGQQNQINSLIQWTSSVVPTDISALNAFTASVAGTNAFTQSINSRVSGLEAATASYANSASVAAVDLAQQNKINSLEAFTASAGLEITALEAFTASIAGTNAFTASATLRLDSLESTSASVNTSLASLNGFTASVAGTNAFTQSAQNSLNSLNAATSSYITSAVTASMNVGTASIAREVVVNAINDNQSTLPAGTVVRITGATGDNPRFNTASYDSEAYSSNTLGVLGSTVTAGTYGPVVAIGTVTGINTDGMSAGDVLYLGPNGTFTNVQPQAPLNIVTLGEVLRVQLNNGSMFVNISNGWELNELHNVRITSAAQGDLLVYEATSSLWKNQSSSSFAKTNQANTFTANQIVSGSMTVTGNLEVFGSASFTTVTSSVYIGGNTIILNTFSPAVRFGGMSVIDSGSTGLTGSLLWDSEKDKWIYSNPSGGAYDSAMLISGPKNTSGIGNELGLVNNYIMKAVGDDHISSSQMMDDGTTVTIPYTASIGSIVGIGSPSAFSSSVDSRINNLISVDSSLNAFTASIAGTNTFTASIAGTNAFTTSANARLGQLEIASASAVVSIANDVLTPLTFNYTNGAGTVTGVTLTAPAGTDITALNQATASLNATTASLNSATASLYTSASLALKNASATLNTITFTKGDDTTFNVTVNTGSAITFPYTGSAVISGSLGVTGSISIVSSSFSGAVITNLTDTYTDVSAVQQIVTLTSASYSSLVTGGTTNPNTLYVVTGQTAGATVGSNTFTGTQIMSGSVQGKVGSVSITSLTASIDFSTGNFFTLDLAATVATHILPTNIAPGETVSLRIVQNATPGTVTYPPAVKFATGNAYTASTTAGAIDIITFVTFDTSSVYANSVKALV